MGSNALHDLAVEAGTLITVGNYSATAVYTIHVYEWMFTIEDELTLIHQRNWTSVKVAYFICRYYPLIVFPFHMWAWIGTHEFKTCSRIVHALYTLILPCPLSCQAVILIRAHAFTGRKKITLCAFLAGFIGLTVGNIYVFGTHFVASSDLNKLLGPSACYGDNKVTMHGEVFSTKGAAGIGFVLLAAFMLDFLAMTLVLFHCYQIRSTQGSLGRTFLRQGVVAFVIISVLNLLAAALCLQPRRQYNGIVLTWLWMLSPLIACRLILSLRRKALPTDTTQFRMHSRLIRDAFDSVSRTSVNEGDHWIPGYETLIIASSASIPRT